MISAACEMPSVLELLLPARELVQACNLRMTWKLTPLRSGERQDQRRRVSSEGFVGADSGFSPSFISMAAGWRIASLESTVKPDGPFFVPTINQTFAVGLSTIILSS